MKAALSLLLVVASCAGATPERALDEYREAIAARDVERVWALSDSSFRAAYSIEALRALLAEDPAAFDAAVSRLSSSGRAGARYLVTSSDGAVVELVRENGAWRVASGALEPASFATPERALKSFFAAIEGRRWNVVRRAIPRRHAAALTGDGALAGFVAELQPRIERARAALGVPAVISGAKAEIAYDHSKRVTFELEAGGWTIVDLE